MANSNYLNKIRIGSEDVDIHDIRNLAASGTDGGAALKTSAIPFGTVDSTSTATAFTATIDGITALEDGVCCYLNNTVITSAAATSAPKCWTLNINNLGAKPVYVTTAATTFSTTQFTLNYKFLFTYDSSLNSGNGGWYIGLLFNTNTTYTAMSQSEIDAGTSTKARSISAKILRDNFYTEDEVDNALRNSQADWNQTSATALDYIKNKPNITLSSNGNWDHLNITGEIINLNTSHKAFYDNKEIAVKDDIPTTSTTIIENDTNPVSGGAVYSKFADLIGSAPAELDTLQEIAAALNDDANLVSTLTAQITSKVPKVSNPTANNFASFNSDGTIKDSGVSPSSFITTETQPDWNVTTTTSAAFIKNKPTIKDELSSAYEMSSDSNDNLALEAGDAYEEAFAKLEKGINDDELVLSAALNDLNKRINDAPTNLSAFIDDLGNNPVHTHSLYLTSAPVTSVNGLTGAVVIATGENNIIENVTFNGVTATVTNKTAAITASLPTITFRQW